MIEDLVIRWAETAIVNAPVLVFLGIAALDLRKTLRDCMGQNKALLARLLDEVLTHDENTK
jgi:hypothetical protein